MLTETDALRERSREFAVRVLKFVKRLPHDSATETAARQLARSGTGVSSNYLFARSVSPPKPETRQPSVN